MSIPISEPLAVPMRPTLSVPSGMCSAPSSVRSTMPAESSLIRPSAAHSFSTLNAW
jgi:hypothetical protein